MKIEKGTMVVEDTKDNLIDEGDVGIACGCGNSMLEFVFHADGMKSFTNGYRCKNCGNNISVTFQRTGTDSALWED